MPKKKRTLLIGAGACVGVLLLASCDTATFQESGTHKTIAAQEATSMTNFTQEAMITTGTWLSSSMSSDTVLERTDVPKASSTTTTRLSSSTTDAKTQPTNLPVQYRLEEQARLLGRCFYHDGISATYFGFTGTGFELMFTGKKLQAKLVADVESVRSADSRPYLAIYVDNMEKPIKVYSMDKQRDTLVLFESDQVKTVKVRVMKRSEASQSTIGVQELIGDADAVLKPTEVSKRRLVFLGDSITCGYGNEGAPGESFCTRTENGCDTYAARTARHFQADYHCIAQSGIGVCSGYTTTAQPANSFLFKDLYVLTDTAGQRRLFMNKTLYDFSLFQPEAVVLNLGKNDASYTVRAGLDAREQFFAAYRELLTLVREKNPRAVILCTLGPVASPEEQALFDGIETIVQEVNAAGDKKVFSLAFAAGTSDEGLGTDDHPSMATHIRMADTLEKKLSEILGWA